MNSADTKNFCSLVFFGDEYRVADRLKGLRCQHSPVKEVQQQFLEGSRPQGCTSCWNKEAKGFESQRQMGNRTLDHLLNKDIENLRQLCVDQKNEIVYYKIETGNLCNATCVTCGSKYSSAWASLERKHGRTPFPSRRVFVDDRGMQFDPKTFDNDIFFDINYKTAKFINFLGGETTLEKANFEILLQLIQVGNTDCEISFTTHGNFRLTREQEDIIRQFPKMQFNFSIDGINNVYQYLRYPLSWDLCQQNIQYCKDRNIYVSIAIVLSNLNLMYYDQLINWVSSNQIPYFVNFAVNHQHETTKALFAPTVLSYDVKKAILEKNPSQFIKNVLQTHSESDEELYRFFLKDILEKDGWKGIKIQDYLPEFAKIIETDLNKAQY